MGASLVCLSGLGRLLVVFGDDEAQQVVTHDGVQFRPVMGRGLGEQEAEVGIAVIEAAAQVQDLAEAGAEGVVVETPHRRAGGGLVEHDEGVEPVLVAGQDAVPVRAPVVQIAAVGGEAPGEEADVRAAPAREAQRVELDGHHMAVGVAAQFHMDGVIAQAQAFVEPVEPGFQRPGHAADDVRAGVVQAVAHVFGRGEVVLEDVADDGLAAAVEIDVHGIFRALDEGFQQPDLVVQHGGGIFLAPAYGAGRDVVTGGAPLPGVLDAVDAQAEEAHGGLEHAGAGQAVEMGLHDLPQGQLAEMEIGEERGQAPAEQQLVLEQFGGAYQPGIARTAVEPVQGVFRIAVQALPPAAQMAEVAAGDKVEVQPVIQPGLPGSGRIQDRFLPVGGKGGQLRRDIRIFQNDHGGPSCSMAA